MDSVRRRIVPFAVRMVFRSAAYISICRTMYLRTGKIEMTVGREAQGLEQGFFLGENLEKI